MSYFETMVQEPRSVPTEWHPHYKYENEKPIGNPNHVLFMIWKRWNDSGNRRLLVSPFYRPCIMLETVTDGGCSSQGDTSRKKYFKVDSNAFTKLNENGIWRYFQGEEHIGYTDNDELQLKENVESEVIEMMRKSIQKIKVSLNRGKHKGYAPFRMSTTYLCNRKNDPHESEVCYCFTSERYAGEFVAFDNGDVYKLTDKTGLERHKNNEFLVVDYGR